MENTISAKEYGDWLDHFQKHPPLELVLPSLIAQLTAVLAQCHGNKDITPYTFAPWLAEAHTAPVERDTTAQDNNFLTAASARAARAENQQNVATDPSHSKEDNG